MICRILGPPESVVFCSITLFFRGLQLICQVISFKWLCTVLSSPESAISIQKGLLRTGKNFLPRPLSYSSICVAILSNWIIFYNEKKCFLVLLCFFIFFIDGCMSFHKIIRTKANLYSGNILWPFGLFFNIKEETY